MDVANGKVTQISPVGTLQKVWRIDCNPNFKLVGNKLVQCKNNIWKTEFPVCVGMLLTKNTSGVLYDHSCYPYLNTIYVVHF